MQYIPVLESNFKFIKNRPLCLEDGERFVIKHCVYFEGTRKIKLTTTRYGDDFKEFELTEKEFKEFVRKLKPFRKKQEE